MIMYNCCNRDHESSDDSYCDNDYIQIGKEICQYISKLVIQLVQLAMVLQNHIAQLVLIFKCIIWRIANIGCRQKCSCGIEKYYYRNWIFYLFIIDSGYIILKLMCSKLSHSFINYEDIIPYSRYLAKGFYNLNMTFDKIETSMILLLIHLIFIIQIEIFIFKQQNSIGSLISLEGWIIYKDMEYLKNLIMHCLYILIQLMVMASFNNPGGGSNLIGRTNLESARYFNVSLTNFQDNNLYIEFICDVTSANITKEFCAISDYLIVVHYCPPFCLDCTSLTTCNAGYSGFNCAITQYLDFNSTTTEVYSCKNCIQSECHIFINQDECTQCKNNKFQLLNGIFLCNPFTFLKGDESIKCDNYCENCYGNSIQNYLIFIKDYNRGIKRNQYLYLPGYYDDGINLPCFTLWGDLIVLEEEDCNDGNNNPFDSCHKCEFACNFACDICLNRKYYWCKSGYEVHNNDCHSICQGNQLTENSRNCVYSQYECSSNCVDCHFEICSFQSKSRMVQYKKINFNQTLKLMEHAILFMEMEQMCDDGNTN